MNVEGKEDGMVDVEIDKIEGQGNVGIGEKIGKILQILKEDVEEKLIKKGNRKIEEGYV